MTLASMRRASGSLRCLTALLFATGVSGVRPAAAQSVLGSISGAVHDSSGAVVPKAKVVLHRLETNTDRTAMTDGSGNYTAINVEAGTYDITTTAGGFAPTVGKGVILIARQDLKFDVSLSVNTNNVTVTVNASDAGVIETQTAEISASLTPRDVLDLPANYRGAGSTSPLNVVQTLPGVQPDTSGYPPQPSTHPQPALKFSLQGGLPSQTETTVDGIRRRTKPTTISKAIRSLRQSPLPRFGWTG